MAALVVGTYALVNNILSSCDDDDDELVVLIGTAGMLVSNMILFYGAPKKDLHPFYLIV